MRVFHRGKRPRRRHCCLIGGAFSRHEHSLLFHLSAGSNRPPLSCCARQPKAEKWVESTLSLHHCHKRLVSHRHLCSAPLPLLLLLPLKHVQEKHSNYPSPAAAHRRTPRGGGWGGGGGVTHTNPGTQHTLTHWGACTHSAARQNSPEIKTQVTSFH